ncbi:MAG: iron uptake porin [Nostoc sp. DedQUE08]|uniref:iron uptake porin n=1 Tax=Nostoc sp. DedQUE08 TaxID=3075393 RepID=UPI002AD37C8A|nr:iron uptake porin [Nostoc sp. DedQUE08]MDZ8068515.1 iron uptake porin [Nostoc sp. DedQUE08]
MIIRVGKILFFSCLFLNILSTAVLAFELEVENNIVKDKFSDIPLKNIQTQAQVELEPLDNDSSTAADKVTSVSQFSDVQPSDWAFQALQSLIERYALIAGYPNGKFQGNRSLNRYEFATALSLALKQLNKKLATDSGSLANKDTLDTVQRLQREFALELKYLVGSINIIDDNISQLEARQFSTKIKLNGEASFAVSDIFRKSNSSSTVLSYVAYLDFASSFSGRDRLISSFRYGSNLELNQRLNRFTPFRTAIVPSFQGTLITEAYGTNNQLELDKLVYDFPIGDRIQAVLMATGGRHEYYTPSINPFFDDNERGSGAISAFGQRNPIYRFGSGGFGVGMKVRLTDSVLLSAGYLSNEANDPNTGIFQGNYSALGQITFTPSEQLQFGFSYINSYFGNPRVGPLPAPLVGSFQASNPNVFLGRRFSPAITSSYGFQANFQVTDNFYLGGWAGFTDSRIFQVGDAQLLNWAITLAFPDLGKSGSLGGIIIGQEPTLIGLQSGSNLREISIEDDDMSLHLEGFYKYQLNDFISITPGIIWITAPNQSNENDDFVIVTLRTTFKF